MYEVDTENKFHRVFAITVDKYGIDPLLDKIAPKLQYITAYSNHTVRQEERGSPDLISFREYETEDYWWHIMSYNGICRFRDIVEGMTLKIPNLGAIISLTNDSLSELPQDSNNNVITI